MEVTGQQNASWPAKLDSHGRIVIPSEVRKENDWASGTQLILERAADGSLKLTSYRDFVHRIQQHFKEKFVGRSFVDELIQERRMEALREESGS